MPISIEDTTSDALADQLARFSVRQYQRMIECGILTPADAVELLENRVVRKMPKSPEHDATIQQMLRPILRILPEGWDLRIQSAITLADSQPEPDLAIVRGTADNYRTRHPEAAELGLVVEVAGSSLLRDQRDKARIYARAGIAVYWIVNLEERRIEVHTLPQTDEAAAEPHYAQVTHFAAGQRVPLELDGTPLELPVTDLIP
jgi:Uma2 family endonuclease